MSNMDVDGLVGDDHILGLNPTVQKSKGSILAGAVGSVLCTHSTALTWGEEKSVVSYHLVNVFFPHRGFFFMIWGSNDQSKPM